MHQLLKRNSWFLVPAALAFAVAGAPLALFSKADLHLLLNSAHTPAADALFRYATALGDGWAAAIIAVAALFIRTRYGLALGLSNILNLLATQTLKLSVFKGEPRPLAFFQGRAELYLVPGVEVFSHNSFPSGHAAVAFALGLALADMTTSKALKMLFAVAASLVAYSRVYLSQHFLGDIVAGGVLGLLLCTATIMVLEAWSRRSPWLRNPVYRIGKSTLERQPDNG